MLWTCASVQGVSSKLNKSLRLQVGILLLSINKNSKHIKEVRVQDRSKQAQHTQVHRIRWNVSGRAGQMMESWPCDDVQKFVAGPW